MSAPIGASWHLRPMPQRRSARLVAWTLVILMGALWIGSVLVWILDGARPLPLSFARGPIGVVAVGLIALMFGTVGASLASRLPRNVIGWALLVVGLGLGVLMPVNLAIAQAFEVARPVPETTLVIAWLLSTLVTPVTMTLIILVLLLFPDGRLVPGWWRAGAVLAVLGSAILALASAVDPTGLIWYPTLPNPAALPPSAAPTVALARNAAAILVVVGVIVGSGSVIVRYRLGDARTRLQLRWIVVGVVLVAIGVTPFLLARYVLATDDETGERLAALAALGICSLPAAIAVAIVREHLFDVDTLISRTLVYVPLMGLLAGLYAGCVTLFQRLVFSLTGNTSDGVFVLSALLLAAVFSPCRSALEGQVSGRFRPNAPPPRRIEDGEPIPLASGPRIVDPTGEPIPREWRGLDEATLAARIAALERLVAEMREHADPMTHADPAAEQRDVSAATASTPP